MLVKITLNPQNGRFAPKRILLNCLLILFGSAAPFVILEIGIRCEHYIRKGTPLLQNPRSRWDPVLGWAGTEHVIPGTPGAGEVLVIGDSFTEGLGIPTTEMWFARIAEMPPGKMLVAYGGLGYGTVQEILILNRYLAAGRFGMVVLQLCSNDFINNYLPLERLSYLQRAPGPRPYRTESGETIVSFPRPYEWILSPLISYSRIAYRFNNRMDMRIAELAKERKLRSVEFDIQEKGFEYEPFRRSVALTSRLLAEFRDSVGPSKLYFVLADDLEPYTKAFRDIARSLQIPIIIPTRIHPFSDAHRLPDGTHFNAEGNDIFGKIVSERMKATAED